MSPDEELRRGVELFNRRRYFESHQAWEAIYSGLEPRPRELVGALIQLAAGLHLRFERGGDRGPRDLFRQALAALEDLRPECLGIDVEALHREVADYAARLDERRGDRAGWLDRWLAPRISWRR